MATFTPSALFVSACAFIACGSDPNPGDLSGPTISDQKTLRLETPLDLKGGPPTLVGGRFTYAPAHSDQRSSTPSDGYGGACIVWKQRNSATSVMLISQKIGGARCLPSPANSPLATGVSGPTCWIRGRTIALRPSGRRAIRPTGGRDLRRPKREPNACLRAEVGTTNRLPDSAEQRVAGATIIKDHRL